MTREKELELVVKLNRLTTEYLSQERDKELYYINHVREIDRTVIVTLYLKQCHIDTIIKRIVSLVNRLIRKEVEFDNEVAIELHKYYDSRIKRGLSDLL